MQDGMILLNFFAISHVNRNNQSLVVWPKYFWSMCVMSLTCPEQNGEQKSCFHYTV